MNTPPNAAAFREEAKSHHNELAKLKEQVRKSENKKETHARVLPLFDQLSRLLNQKNRRMLS